MQTGEKEESRLSQTSSSPRPPLARRTAQFAGGKGCSRQLLVHLCRLIAVSAGKPQSQALRRDFPSKWIVSEFRPCIRSSTRSPLPRALFWELRERCLFWLPEPIAMYDKVSWAEEVAS